MQADGLAGAAKRWVGGLHRIQCRRAAKQCSLMGVGGPLWTVKRIKGEYLRRIDHKSCFVSARLIRKLQVAGIYLDTDFSRPYYFARKF